MAIHGGFTATRAPADNTVSLSTLIDGLLAATAAGRLKMANGYILDAQVGAAAAIALSKLGNGKIPLSLTAGHILHGGAASGTTDASSQFTINTGFTTILAILIQPVSGVTTFLYKWVSNAAGVATIKGFDAADAPIGNGQTYSVQWFALGT